MRIDAISAPSKGAAYLRCRSPGRYIREPVGPFVRNQRDAARMAEDGVSDVVHHPVQVWPAKDNCSNEGMVLGTVSLLSRLHSNAEISGGAPTATQQPRTESPQQQPPERRRR